MDPQKASRNSSTASMIYTNCNTRIIALQALNLPGNATEQEYRDILSRYSRSKTEHSELLVAAINSVRYGIAPPVAFPTETVYGLGADATNISSIVGIFAAKGRPNDNPLIVHVASKEHLERLTGESLPQVYDQLVKAFWPGPLTILVPVPLNSAFAKNVHPGQKTIGFRVPESKYARFFIATTDRPIAAPSANSSGKPSPTAAQHVFNDLQGKVNFILDGGSCNVGVESTVVDGLCDPPVILRPGGVSHEKLIAHGEKYNSVWAKTEIGYKQKHSSQEEEEQSGMQTNMDNGAPRAPGMKYKHYAPKGKMTLFENLRNYSGIISEVDHLIDSTLVKTLNQYQNAVHERPELMASESGEILNIGILTSTTWPKFAGLAIDNGYDQKKAVAETIFDVGKASLTKTDDVKHQSLISASLSTPTQQEKPSTETDGEKSDSSNNVGQVSTGQYRMTATIHSINLGQTPRRVAHSLFAALRKCDDLNCHYILVEAPTKGTASTSTLSASASSPSSSSPSWINGKENIENENGNDDDNKEAVTNEEDDENAYYDAVIERMRKAASSIRLF